LLILVAAPLEAATIEKIRSSHTESRTRIVLDLDAPPKYIHRALSDPSRILVEFKNWKFVGALDLIPVAGGTVKRVRRNKLSDGRAQVVLDLERPASYTVFALTGPHRLVVDVTPVGSAAPPAAAKPPEPQPVTPAPERPAASEKQAAPRTEPAKKAATPSARPTIVPPAHGPWRIAVDAGHGGQDPGARGHGTREKDITLKLAVLTVEELNKRPNIEAFLVRKGDYAIPLGQRRALAEDRKAHLFVSIHCNASKNRQAQGTEVFFLSLEGASDQAARELAERENAADEAMGISADAPDLDRILFDMQQVDALAKSAYLAETVLHRLFALGTVYNRGVKQANFVVLRSPRVPSVLVEAAFITNKQENKLLRNKDWQKKFARLLSDGLQAYCESVEEAE
jgi:N-acetylmuramoyl-L-alanine amidase